MDMCSQRNGKQLVSAYPIQTTLLFASLNKLLMFFDWSTLRYFFNFTMIEEIPSFVGNDFDTHVSFGNETRLINVKTMIPGATFLPAPYKN